MNPKTILAWIPVVNGIYFGVQKIVDNVRKRRAQRHAREALARMAAQRAKQKAQQHPKAQPPPLPPMPNELTKRSRKP